MRQVGVRHSGRGDSEAGQWEGKVDTDEHTFLCVALFGHCEWGLL